jgi:hypothetical protein
MIEIEVEMDVEVPAAEVQGIEAQISRLMEVTCPTRLTYVFGGFV